MNVETTPDVQTTTDVQTQVAPATTFKEIAMPLVARGIPIIPIPPRQKGTILKGWPNLASTDPQQIEKWHKDNPQYNVGAVAKLDGFWFLDCDVADLPQQIEQATGQTFPKTFSVTSSKGIHFYFKHSEPSQLLKQNIQLKDEQNNVLCDVKIQNGYVVGPGSTHPSGKLYEVVDDSEIVEAPDWLVAWIKGRHEHAEAAEKHQYNSSEGKVKEGGRDNFLFKKACSFHAVGLTKAEALTALLIVNEKRCDPQMDVSVVEQKIESAYKSSNHTAVNDPFQIPGKPSLTDFGNAKRFVTAAGKDIRYCFTNKKWFVWDGRKWAEDDTGEIHRRAKGTVLAMLQEAATLENDQERRSLVIHEHKSESEGRVNSMISLARSEEGVYVRLPDFDSDAMLFNCLNGTLDLTNGTLRQHCRDDLTSKIAPTEFDPSAACPTWLKFLDTVTSHNTEMTTYLQRCAGYSLTGDTSEHALFLLYGTGANGKSTFLEALRFVLGDYAQSADFQSLMVSQGQSVRNDLAKLNGARFVTATESEDGKRMAENVVKQLTGGDTITTRFLYQDYFEFAPQFKLWLGTNHKPVIRGQDVGIWRRIRLIPFTVSIPPDQQDRDLKRKLKLEAPGILSWALEGLAQWRLNGLQEPDEVKNATKEYRADQDVLLHFIDTYCIQKVGVKSSARDLYRAYKQWAEETNEWTMSERRFSTALAERGINKVRHGGGMIWKGIAVLPSDQDCEAPPTGDY